MASKKLRFSLLLVTFLVIFGAAGAPSASAATCAAGQPAQNGYTVVPSHGPVFYTDTGVTPALDAGYIGYRVTNSTGSSKADLWAQVSTFSGGVLSLANSLDSNQKLPTIANGATGVSYFLLKATGATSAAQSHKLRVYDKRPDLSGASVLYDCDFSFSRVKETIKAGANKVEDNGFGTSAAIEVSDTTPELGQSITLTVEGATGNIGSGSTPDFDILWLTPAAISSWPTRALRLESVSVTFDGNGNWANTGDQVTYTNQLLITSANGLTNVDGAEYRATYTFKVVGSPASSVKAVPVAMIASGTQVKHTDTGAAGATIDISFSALTVNAALTKSVTSTTGLTVIVCGPSCVVPSGVNGETYVEVPYRLTAATTSASSLTIDEIVDAPNNLIIYKPGSATITDIGRSAVAISDPVYIASESALSPRPVHFVGPFTFNSGTNASLDYRMYVPVGSFANTAYAKIGDLLIGSTSSAMSRITITSTGTSTVGVVSDTVSFSINATTDPATAVTTTGATLNGTVDPNGTAVVTGQFQYGTSPSLIGATTVTATTPTSGTLGGLTDPTAVSVALTGLTSGTTYYYRVIAGSAQGTILSFTTTAVLAPPTSTTTAATSVATTTATLNGTINPNLTAVTGIQFVYGTAAALDSGNTTVTVDDGTGLAALTAGGSSSQPFSYDTTGLTAGTTYYFKIRACTSALSGTYPNHTCASFVDGSILSFNASTVPSVTTSAASSVTASAATLNGSVTANGASTTTSFTYSTVSNLSSGTTTVSAATVNGTSPTSINAAISGLAPGTTYYFRANGTNSKGSVSGSILSFTTTGAAPTARTLAIDGGSYDSTYVATATPPTITSTPSAGAGTKSYSSLTTGICTVNSSSGVVTFVSTGTCTIVADITYDGTYAAATSSSISFSITTAARTLAIDGGSYASNYSILASAPTITSTPSAGTGTKTYSSSTSGVCTVDSSSGAVTFVSTGTCTITADIATDGTYAAATSSSISFNVNLAARTHAIDGGSYASSYTMIATPPTITSTPSAGTGTKSYSSSTTGVCTINASSGVVTFVSTGTCTIGSSIASDGTYAVANASTVSFSVTLASRTLAIDGGSYTSSYSMIATPPTITSTASAGAGTKSYSSSTTGVCTVNSSSGVVTFVSAGTCTITADIAADGTYAAATSSSVSFGVTLAVRTLAIDGASYAASYIISDTAPTITSTASAGAGTKSYSSSTTGVCTINSSSGVVTFISTGTCTIGAGITADGTYAVANATNVSFSISAVPLTSRTLSIDGGSYTSTYTMTTTPPTITSTPSAGAGTKSYSSSTTGVCTVNSSSGVVTFVSAGTCTIGSSITDDGTYAAANASTVSFSVTLSPRTHAIDGGSYASSYTMIATPPTITSTPSAGTGTKSYSSSTTGVCTINASSGVVTFVSAGTCTIGSSIASDATYAIANASTVSFSVTLASRTIAIDGASYSSSYVVTDTAPTLTSTPSAGAGTKTYSSSTTGVCTVNASSGAVTFVTAGTCTIGVTIAASGSYAAATSSEISFTVSAVSSGGGSNPSPSNTSISINSGAACTSSRNVTLTLGAYTANQSIVADNQYFIGASWESFAPPSQTKSWTLPSTDGTYSVYAMYKYGSQQSGYVSDSIVLDQTGNCGSSTPTPLPTPAPAPNPSPTPTTPPVTETPKTSPTAATCQADCANVTYDLYIVNPDGTERHISDARYVRTERLSETLSRYSFEDNGRDFDFNDVVIEVDRTDCTKITATAVSVDARWEHNVRMTILFKGLPIRDLLVWKDSHMGIGTHAHVNANEGDAVCLGTPLALEIVLPEITPYRDPSKFDGKDDIMSLMGGAQAKVPVQSCADTIRCEDVSYDLHIINPDGSERRMDSRYVALTTLDDGRIRVGFEDSGKDFDFDDVVAVIDKRDCANVTVEVLGVGARWHHKMILDVFLQGRRMFDAMIWNDTHAAGGSVKSVDAKNHPAMCGSAAVVEPAAAGTGKACTMTAPVTSGLSFGSSEPSVIRMQGLLACLGHLPPEIVANGYFGPATEQAVRAFQTSKGIDPIGIVGPRTRAALNTYLIR